MVLPLWIPIEVNIDEADARRHGRQATRDCALARRNCKAQVHGRGSSLGPTSAIQAFGSFVVSNQEYFFFLLRSIFCRIPGWVDGVIITPLPLCQIPSLLNGQVTICTLCICLYKLCILTSNSIGSN